MSQNSRLFPRCMKLKNMNSIAAEQFVIDNEILGMAMRVLRGVEVSDETLALEVIDRVGPGGHYRMEEHTLRHLRSEFYYPSAVVDRKGWESWLVNDRQIE